MSLLAEIEHALRGWGHGPAILEVEAEGVREISAASLLARIDARAGELHAAGLRGGDRVALLLRNSSDFLTTFLAAAKIGAVPAPLKTDWRSTELGAVFANLEPALTVAEEENRAMLGALPHRGGLVLRTGPEAFHALSSPGSSGGPPRGTGPAGPAGRDNGHAPLPEGIASINYTYRGYGYPLGAMIPEEQYLHGARIFASGMGNRPCRRMLVILPMAHIFTLVGCIWAPLLHGMSTVLLNSVHPRKVFDTVERFGVDFVTAVPELLRFFAGVAGTGREREDDGTARTGREPATRSAARTRALDAVDIVASGGSTLTAEDYHSITERFGVELLHGYGLTEFTPVSRNIRETARPGTVGPPGEGVECRIVEASPETGVGEIAVRAPSMTHGYFREPDLTADAFRHGWFLTGDYGRFDDGHLVFVSEKKRTCKVNGTMVDLSEIERVVESIFPETEAHAQLSDQGLAVCVGGPGARAEAERQGMSLQRSVKSALKGVMAAHKIPKIVYEDASGA